MDEKLWIMIPRSTIHALILIRAAIRMAAPTESAIILHATPSTHSLDFENNSLR